MARTIDPLVSTDWLESRLEDVAKRDPVVVDIREPRLYSTGHIPGSVSIPFSPMSEWAVSDDDLLMELPPDEDLCALLDEHEITASSAVVLVGTVEPGPAPPYALSDAPRVAATLFHAGVANVAILEGGYPKWQAEGRPSFSGEPAGGDSPAPEDGGAGRWDCSEVVGTAGIFVSTEYVKDRLDLAVVIDGRDPDQYFGVTPCPFAGVGGHIPTARSLPAPWMWNSDGTYKPVEVLRAMVEGVVGAGRDQEIIAYCGVGGYAAAWWFVLSQILDYSSVKIYDGAAEAWVKSDSMVCYTW